MGGLRSVRFPNKGVEVAEQVKEERKNEFQLLFAKFKLK
jgi:hypothetical protein